MSFQDPEKPALAAAEVPVVDKPRERRHRVSKEDSAGGSRHHHHHSHDKKKRRKSADASTSSPTTSSAPKRRDAAANEDEEDWEGNRAAVERICAQYPNNVCADCGETGTRWASVNHGVFVCIRCSGVHRSLGVHISKVKSTNMDRWLLAEVCLMGAIGNAKAKALYEAHLPAGVRPAGGAGAAADDAIKSFIQRKYAQREFAMHNLKDVLGRLYKDTGYGRPKRASKPGAAAEGPLSSSMRASSSAAAPVDRAAVAGQRNDTMRALYGDAAAEMHRGASRKEKNAAALSAAVSAPKPTYGTFGMVNVPPEEYEARWQRTLAVFSFVDAPQAADPAPEEEMPSRDQKEMSAAAETSLPDPNDTLAGRSLMGGAEATPEAVADTSFTV
ncbi:hypothetical protein GH5_03598 [Leishmania sp. Ghana 2012 LV757]|uniref:hypothetical protein n=1 Tax=Leishmania sp. Ghana 2012 LV757 TaxID=2803181 RepID=UPI001B6DE8ED|nr:hypothetical protein GH5_03598 [Leishmania sp. Ghana 2012 LV757]